MKPSGCQLLEHREKVKCKRPLQHVAMPAAVRLEPGQQHPLGRERMLQAKRTQKSSALWGGVAVCGL